MRSDYLDPRLYNRLFEVMQWANVLAMRVSLETGLRIDDVLSRKPEDLNARTLFFTAKKTGKQGKKTISSDLAKHLRAQAGKFWLFPGRDPRQHRTRQTVWRDVKKAARTQGLSGQISPHSARKSYAVELREEKGIAEVQKELQHERADTTMLYAFSDVLTARNSAEVRETPQVPTEGDIDRFADKIAQRVAEILKNERIIEKNGEKLPKKAKNGE